MDPIAALTTLEASMLIPCRHSAECLVVNTGESMQCLTLVIARAKTVRTVEELVQ